MKGEFNMQFSIKCAVLATMATLGCATEAPEEAAQPSAELRALGVDHFDVVAGASTLAIRAVSVAGEEIATLDLSVGRFVMTVDDRGEVDGRRMAVRALGKTALHESEGRLQLTLPLPADPNVGAFLSDPTVTRVLAPWGIGFEAANDLPLDLTLADGEAGYEFACQEGDYLLVNGGSGSNCQTSTYGGCTASSKKKWDRGGGEWGETRCCSNGTAAERRCKTAYAATSCGQAGPQGCAVCWDLPWVGSCRTFCNGIEFCSV